MVANINDDLVKLGYVVNVYERKPKTFLIDIITTQTKRKSYVISVVQALYLYSDLEDRIPDQVHLMFRRVEGSTILDMGLCTDMSAILKAVTRDVKRKGEYQLKKLTNYERCRVCFAKQKLYEQHAHWCKGTNSQQFLFEKRALQTFEEHVHCRETPPVTAYYDLETATSHEEFKVISFSYVVAFRWDLRIPQIIVYRSATMDVAALTSTRMVWEVEDQIDGDDVEKFKMCAHDVMRQRPHAMTQLLTMELVSLLVILILSR